MAPLNTKMGSRSHSVSVLCSVVSETEPDAPVRAEQPNDSIDDPLAAAPQIVRVDTSKPAPARLGSSPMRPGGVPKSCRHGLSRPERDDAPSRHTQP